MALLYFDGFEQYTSAPSLVSTSYNALSSMPGRWVTYNDSTGTTFNTAGYRTAQPAGTNATSLRFYVAGSGAPNATLGVPSSTTLITGFATNVSALAIGVVLRVWGPNGGSYITLTTNGSGQLILTNNRTSVNLIVTASNVFFANNWHYVELKMTCGASGSAELIVDGTSVGTATAVDTRGHTSDTQYNRLQFGVPSTVFSTIYIYMDDLYVCDGTGATHNNFLGPVKVYTLFPNANGTTNQFTPTGVANNWDAVDEQLIDTTTYVASSTTNQVDMYAVKDLPITPTTVYAVAVGSCAIKTESSARQYRNNVTVSGTTTNGTTVTPVLSYYLWNQDLFTTAPGGAAWTAADVNSMQIGVEVL